MAALAASLSSSPRLESVPASGLDVSQESSIRVSQSSLGSLLGKNWSVLHSWGGWSVTPWLRLRLASSGDAHAGGAFEVSFMPFRTFIRPTLTFERGSAFSVTSSFSALRNGKATDRSGTRSFNYYYDGAYLGAEFGTRWFDVSVNFGMSRTQACDPGFRSVFQGSFGTEAAQIGPAAKLGLLVRL
jgi:hypothetical protein